MTTDNLQSAQESAPAAATAWPPMVEEVLTVGSQHRLFTRLAEPDLKERARVVLMHGFGEHSGRYGRVAQELVARGFGVAGWDLRGHGRSTGERADIADSEWFVDDLETVCRKYRRADLPFFIFGHSLGGQLVLRLLERGTIEFQGAAVASPWLRLAHEPPHWKVILARIAMRLWPQFTQPTGARPERLSRDLEYLTSLPEFSLVYHRISARTYFALKAAGEELIAQAGRVRTPLLLLHGDDDPITSHHATCEFFERVGSPDKTLRIFPAARHEMHNDLHRDQVLREVGDWMEARVTRPPGGV